MRSLYTEKRFKYRCQFNQTVDYLNSVLSNPDKIRNKDSLKDRIAELETLMRQINELDVRHFGYLPDSTDKQDALDFVMQDTTKFTDDYINVKRKVEEITKNSTSALGKVGWFAVKTAAISGAVLGGVAFAVPAIGFTAGGVAAGSMAAAYQSAVLGGTIASGSAFAVLQSVGAAGLAAGTQAAVVGGSALVAGIHSIVKK